MWWILIDFKCYIGLLIILFKIELQHTNNGRGSGFIPIAEYGGEYGKGSRKLKAKKAVRLLYSGKNHYDLLV